MLRGLTNNFKFIFYKRKGRKFLLRKKFINPFILKFNNFIFKYNIKKKYIMPGVFLKDPQLGLYSIYHFMNFYNIWYNKLIIQKKSVFCVHKSRYFLTNFRVVKNKTFSHELLVKILQSVFLFGGKKKINKRKLSFFERSLQRNFQTKKFFFLMANFKKKKKNLYCKIGYKKTLRVGKKIKRKNTTKIYFDFNFNCINFHKIFLNIISKIGNNLSFYYNSFYNHIDSNKFPIQNDYFSSKEKNSIKDRFLNHLNIIFAFVKEKFLIVNLIDPAIGLNMYSAHPSLVRRRISRFFSLSQKEQMSKYVFLFKLKKKKALKNKFLRTLTIIAASRRLFFIQRTNPRVLNFILNIPRHIIDKTLYYSFAFFIKPYPSVDIPIEDIRQRLDYDPSRDKRNKDRYQSKFFRKHRYMKKDSDFNKKQINQHKFDLSYNFKKRMCPPVVLKFIIKYMFFLNLKSLGKNLFANQKRNLFFFLFIFAFLLKRIRIFMVLVLRNTFSIVHLARNYKKQLNILKYLLKFFIISYKLHVPYKDEILSILRYKSKKKKMKIFQKLPIFKIGERFKTLQKYFLKNILKNFENTLYKSKLKMNTKVHNIVFTSCQSHGSFLKIAKNRRI